MTFKFRAWESKNRNDLGVLINPYSCILMQFVGSKDMHGTDIYEGDIIRKEECSPDDVAFGYYGSIGVVKYDASVMGFIIDSEDSGFYDNTGAIFSFNEIEVIGNIYENSDIVKEVV